VERAGPAAEHPNDATWHDAGVDNRARVSVLLVSASMGAGHDGAAHELARRLAAAGHHARVVDLFDAAPRALVWFWRESYRFQLRFAPGAYERAYQLYYRRSRSWEWTLRALRRITRRSLLRWTVEVHADAVVSTYALGTLILGEMRARGELTVPLVNFITDFGIHPRTVHPSVDLNLTVHEVATHDARTHVRGPVITTGPAVSPRVREELPDRREARAALGIAPDAQVVLVAAGSWGVGDNLPETVAALHADGRFTVLTLCGRDDRLRRALLAQGLAHVWGWTPDVPRFLAAADVLVENAGGLTAMEACAAGVAVVSFRPIPGHGRENAAAMARAGVCTPVRSLAELCTVVDELSRDTPRRRARLAAADAMFVADPAELIVAVAQGRRTPAG
jgi:UDP-N-acetylglucosamine:LPS N-acetylglucosamine transferase